MTAAACHPAPAPTFHALPIQTQTEIEPSALVATPPATHQTVMTDDRKMIATGKRNTLWVGGCNTACIDCSLASYQSFVVGTLTRTGAQLFPYPHAPAPGYMCGAEVAIGERVTLRAHTTEGLVIESWSRFFDKDSCPCEGTAAMTCTFEVTPEIASRSDRIYCGAAWKQRATAQIGQ